MRRRSRLVLAAGVAAAAILGCNAILGVEAHPLASEPPDSTTGDDAETPVGPTVDASPDASPFHDGSLPTTDARLDDAAIDDATVPDSAPEPDAAVPDGTGPSDAPSDAIVADAGPDAQDAAADAAPYFAALFVSQSFPFASSPLTMTEGQTIPSSITLKNVGTTAWTSSTQLATTEPRDRASVFADATWVSSSRAAAVSGTIEPGSSYTFSFDLHAPQATGTYFEYFGLVDGTVWFGDPGQGGPPDDDIEVQIQVTP